MNVNLPTGKTICVSVFEYYFILKEEDVDAFFQSCIADDLGEELNNPFSARPAGKIEVEEETDNIEE
jgi:hypothetical protein